MATKTVHRLEQALCLWEEMCMTMNVGARMLVALGRKTEIPLTGPVVHWREFRRYLLHALEHDSFDESRFVGNVGVQHLTRLSGSFLVYLPLAIWSWTRSSRRVYHLSEELQHLLHITSLDGVTWGDVSWPFASFGIMLDSPIPDNKGNRYDFILVSNEIDSEDNRRKIGIRLFNVEYDNWRFLPRDEQNKILLAADRKQWDKVRLWIEKVSERSQSVTSGEKEGIECSVFHIDPEQHASALITDTIVADLVELSEQKWLDDTLGRQQANLSHWDVAARLVVGLCLYLKMLPQDSEHVSPWKKVERKMSLDPLAVTKEAEVCTITSIHKLTQEEHELISGSVVSARAYHELRAHFRQGHWRRKPGAGNDPTAPKVVMVRPTIVRRDRLQSGALPGGTEQILT